MKLCQFSNFARTPPSLGTLSHSGIYISIPKSKGHFSVKLSVLVCGFPMMDDTVKVHLFFGLGKATDLLYGGVYQTVLPRKDGLRQHMAVGSMPPNPLIDTDKDCNKPICFVCTGMAHQMQTASFEKLQEGSRDDHLHYPLVYCMRMSISAGPPG